MDLLRTHICKHSSRLEDPGVLEVPSDLGPIGSGYSVSCSRGRHISLLTVDGSFLGHCC